MLNYSEIAIEFNKMSFCFMSHFQCKFLDKMSKQPLSRAFRVNSILSIRTELISLNHNPF